MKTKILALLLIFTFMIQNSAIAEKKRVGIVLSGGGALGFAHIGALKALEEHGIYPDEIAGASMGALIGVLYANGYTPDYIYKIVNENKLYSISKILKLAPSMDRKGLSSHEPLERLLPVLLPHDNFDSLPKPFYTSITTLENGESKIVSKGKNLIVNVIASSSIPGIFEPEIINGYTCVDGGLLNNLPAQPLKKSCDYIIGVDVIDYKIGKPIKNTKDVFNASLRTFIRNNSIPGREMCDHLIEPGLLKYHELEFSKFKEISEIGYHATIEYIKKNPSILKLSKNPK